MKQNFNDNWICYPKNEKERAAFVTLPHDAMQSDPRSETSPGGENTGWYEARDYVYEKYFRIGTSEAGRQILLEFEGVYKDAAVFVNGRQAAFHDYGYTGFYADITAYLLWEQENQIRVEVSNSDQPNSRWYTGTGIYRPVWMHILQEKCILPDGVRISTLSAGERRILIQVRTSGPGKVTAELLDQDEILYSAEEETDGVCRIEACVGKARLWNPDDPKLYTCRILYGQDCLEIPFGIREITLSKEHGFCVNGERVILKGACIHHDNGILGARAYDYAERRKIRILKEQGYNAVRSSHNPCSKALLSACDELGMLVLDEYVDCWYIHKTKYDYADRVSGQYKRDLKDMVDKDYNHPSVIMYSIGNEVSETAQKKGIALAREMTEELHRLDPSRPVTCGVNIFFNFLSSAGFGVYSDKKAESAVKDGKNKKAVGSAFFNQLAGLLGSDFMKFGATLYPCDLKTREAFAVMDAAGYNYGIRRYRHDLKKYPDRFILGSETFCSDAARFWEMAKENPRLIGDFVWAGMDYLGEVGLGAWEYEDYAPRMDHGCGWIAAGAGRIDLTGKPTAEMAYTKVAFDQEIIGMGVVPVNHTKEKHSPSAWKMSNALESWSWNGCGGKTAKVEVYSKADSVKLWLNGTCAGEGKPDRNGRISFSLPYQDGELKASAYDSSGCLLGEKKLITAGEETKLSAEPEQTCIKRTDLCFVRLRYTDGSGILKPLIRGKIKVRAQGGTVLASGSACPYYPDPYLSDTTDTYYGEALAVICPDGNEKISITAESPFGTAEAEVTVH